MVASRNMERVVTIMTSAEHKIASWERNVPKVDILAKPNSISLPRGLPEPDVTDREECAIGKLQRFLARQGAMKELEKVHSDMAGIVDILAVVDGMLLTTDRNGAGALVVLAQLAEQLKPATQMGSPVTIHAHNVAGFARMRDIREYGSKLPGDKVISAWGELSITLSPSLVNMLGDKRVLKSLHRRGYLDDGILKSESICGLDWTRFVLNLPGICAMASDDDLWMEVMGGREHYRVDHALDDVEPAHILMDEYLRGVPIPVVSQILAS